ncbi:hypothetical protein BFP72_08760 [Reichenbachiella sp. 5M10]|uniref:VOC family protein n=1 Tax=Reichenbachiella sp. 5M10 TaxID=1889772 RepID=UPI000C15A1F2|nr:VOC family protein [Reichenbachiella sp. 5M10]PIB35475.1 hypothetical protein BFP72_08760 [Reichenbachiella sp. 5M10]
MKIEHIGLWVKNLEEMRTFYQQYFEASCNQKYENSTKGFSSYFLSWTEGARLELMMRHDVTASNSEVEKLGWAHLALSVGDRGAVDELTEKLRTDGYQILSEPRSTGDGYYESVVLDPEGNRVEITI